MAIIFSILSILIGYIVIAAIVTWSHFLTSRFMQTGPFPTRNTIYVNLGVGLAAAILGGMIAAVIAPSYPMIHAMILAGVMGSVSAAMLMTGPQPGQPPWYPLAVMGEGVFGALIGGAIIAL